MPKTAKRITAARENIDREKHYAITDAVKALQDTPKPKFDESVEVAINLNVDPRHADQMVRGSVVMPNGTGKTVRIAVFAKGDAAKAAEEAGADVVGAEDLAKKVQDGFLDFDRVIAAPDCMAIVGQIGKILGPKGLMPNPKLGTVTPDVAKAVSEAKSGQVQFRVEKNGIIHAAVGKRSLAAGKLQENIVAFIDAIKAAKPTGAKGQYMERVTISSTMGPGIKVDLASLAEASA